LGEKPNGKMPGSGKNSESFFFRGGRDDFAARQLIWQQNVIQPRSGDRT
jgi:hypothetical protein